MERRPGGGCVATRPENGQPNRSMEAQRHLVPEAKCQLNVAAILRRPSGEIFIAERVTHAGAWQFPQGGVDEGESLEDALKREIWEEIGVLPQDYRLIDRRGPYHYLFPDGLVKRGHHGKEQWYFLCEYTGPDERINVATEHPEFRAWRWIRPEDFDEEWLPPMKRDVYREVFRDFFSLNLKFKAERH